MNANATVTIETVEPKKAQHYLATLLDSQRNLREGHVLRLATEIESGNWHLTSDALLLVKKKDGVWYLANGQHRLQAAILADKPVQFLVLRTEDEEVYKVLDAGLSRTTGDALQQMGISAGKEVAAVALMVLRYDYGAITSFGNNRDKCNRITRSKVIDYIEEHHKALEKETAEVMALRAQKRILSTSIGAAFLHLANRRGIGDPWSFIRNLYLGGTQDSAFDLRERLIKNNSAKLKLPREYIFGLVIKAYKSFVNGTRPGVLKIIEGEEFPKLP